MINLTTEIANIESIIKTEFSEFNIEITSNADLTDIPNVFNLNDLIIINLINDVIPNEAGGVIIGKPQIILIQKNSSKYSYNESFLENCITMSDLLYNNYESSIETFGRLTPDYEYCQFELSALAIEKVENETI